MPTGRPHAVMSKILNNVMVMMSLWIEINNISISCSLSNFPEESETQETLQRNLLSLSLGVATPPEVTRSSTTATMVMTNHHCHCCPCLTATQHIIFLRASDNPPASASIIGIPPLRRVVARRLASTAKKIQLERRRPCCPPCSNPLISTFISDF